MDKRVESREGVKYSDPQSRNLRRDCDSNWYCNRVQVEVTWHIDAVNFYKLSYLFPLVGF